jgi:hypothetical protein
MSRVLPRHALVLLAMALLAAACTSRGTATKPSTAPRNPTATTLPPTDPATLVATVTPKGWVPVDFGDAQVSVPADWLVHYDFEQIGDSAVGSCALPVSPGVIYVGEWSSCSLPNDAGPSAPVVTIEPLTNSWAHALLRPSRVNGILVEQVGASGIYLVPSVDVVLTASGRGTAAVLRTLTHSPAAAVLAPGPAPVVPNSWRWMTAGAISVAVPAGWPTTRTAVQQFACGLRVVGARDSVVLDSDASGSDMECPFPVYSFEPQPPSNGLVVDLHPPTPPPATLAGCLHVAGVTACPMTGIPTPRDDFGAEIDVLSVIVTVPGNQPEVLEIGLGGNGMVARTILYSLRAA